MSDLVCRFCGGDNFFADVEISGSAWCDVAIDHKDNGKLGVETDGRPQEIDAEIAYITVVGCAGCDKRVPERQLEELIGPRYQPKVGDRVVLPDGLEAVVEAVLPQRWASPSRVDPRTWLLAAGREYTTAEVQPVPANPNQLALLEAP